MRLILTLATFLIFKGNAYADRYCDPVYGPQDDLASLIKVVSREFDSYEVYLPKSYQGKDLSFVDLLIEDGGGKEGYFHLSYTEEKGMYYLHLGLEPINHKVSLRGNYGKGECNYQGIVVLKRNKRL